MRSQIRTQSTSQSPPSYRCYRCEHTCTCVYTHTLLHTHTRLTKTAACSSYCFTISSFNLNLHYRHLYWMVAKWSIAWMHYNIFRLFPVFCSFRQTCCLEGLGSTFSSGLKPCALGEAAPTNKSHTCLTRGRCLLCSFQK